MTLIKWNHARRRDDRQVSEKNLNFLKSLKRKQSWKHIISSISKYQPVGTNGGGIDVGNPVCAASSSKNAQVTLIWQLMATSAKAACVADLINDQSPPTRPRLSRRTRNSRARGGRSKNSKQIYLGVRARALQG